MLLSVLLVAGCVVTISSEDYLTDATPVHETSFNATTDEEGERGSEGVQSNVEGNIGKQPNATLEEQNDGLQPNTDTVETAGGNDSEVKSNLVHPEEETDQTVVVGANEKSESVQANLVDSEALNDTESGTSGDTNREGWRNASSTTGIGIAISTEKTETIEEVGEDTTLSVNYTETPQAEAEQQSVNSPDEVEETTAEDVDGGESSKTVESDLVASTTTEASEDGGGVDQPSGEGEANGTSEASTIREELSHRVDKLSDQIRSVLETYQRTGTVTMPDAPIPDPMSVPNIVKTLGGAPMTFTGMMVYGLKNFTVDHVNTDLDKMQVFLSLHMDRLYVLGNYTIRSWFSSAAGPFNVTLLDVQATGAAKLEPDAEGRLQATDSEMDMTFTDTIVDFKNLGFMGSLVQGFLGSAGSILFDGIKPFVLAEVNDKMRTQVNAKIKQFVTKIVNQVSPVDLAVAEGRRYVKEKGYDPFYLRQYNMTEAVFNVNISELWVHGMSQFQRVGEVDLSMDRGVVQMGLHVATGQLEGNFSWAVQLGPRIAPGGLATFTIEHLQVRGVVNQSLDLRIHPLLDDLDIGLGKLRIKVADPRSYGYIVQLAINTLPNLIRHLLVDTLEDPVKWRVQQILDEVDVERFVHNKLPVLDSFGV